MAISMSSSKVDDSERTSLLGKTVDSSVLISQTMEHAGMDMYLPVNDYPLETGAKLAGVTSTFATNVCTKINTYIQEVDGALEDMTSVASSGAFKGTSLSNAISTFISAVTSLSKDYTNRLKIAEMQIIGSVSGAYSTQDSDLSGNLNTDSASVLDNNGVSAPVDDTRSPQPVTASRADVPGARPGGAMEQ